jgi:hypothetical protein
MRGICMTSVGRSGSLVILTDYKANFTKHYLHFGGTLYERPFHKASWFLAILTDYKVCFMNELYHILDIVNVFGWLVGWLVSSCCSNLKDRAFVKRFISLQFLNLRHPVGLLGRAISPSQGRYLSQTEWTQTSMLRVRFEPMIPASALFISLNFPFICVLSFIFA